MHSFSDVLIIMIFFWCVLSYRRTPPDNVTVQYKYFLYTGFLRQETYNFTGSPGVCWWVISYHACGEHHEADFNTVSSIDNMQIICGRLLTLISTHEGTFLFTITLTFNKSFNENKVLRNTVLDGRTEVMWHLVGSSRCPVWQVPGRSLTRVRHHPVSVFYNGTGSACHHKKNHAKLPLTLFL